MKYLNTFTYLVIIATTLFSCASQDKMAIEATEHIDQVYFQKWIGGQEHSGSGTNFHVKFTTPLAEDVYLVKVYFRNQEAFFEMENNEERKNAFIAIFYNKSTSNDLIMDGNSNKEYGNKAPDDKKESPPFPYDLKENEAILEFHIKNKVTQIKITNIKEKEVLAYPSTRPRN